MTIGIYSLYWPHEDIIYIGQSSNIERRWLAHSRYFIRGEHANYKAQNAFNKYGQPQYSILEECSIELLLQREREWSQEFDNIINIQTPGVQVGLGLNNPNSKHSKLRILRAFIYLYKYNYTAHKTSMLSKIPKGTIGHIQCGKAHLWLLSKYPEQYNIMLQNAKNSDKRSSNFEKPITLKSVAGNTEKIVNLLKFAEENNVFKIKTLSFYRGLQKLVSGNIPEYKGYTLLNLD